MLRQNEYEKALAKRAEEFDEKYDNISSLLDANFKSPLHKMLVGENCFEEFYGNCPETFLQEISTFEKVDLIDCWKFDEYGRTD